MSDVQRRPSIGAHLDAGARQIDALKHAAAVARVLDRTLVVPRLTCFCDKVWGGHDNIWNFDCHYPGSADSAHVPGPCPLDHFVSPSALRRAGVRFVAEAELTGLGVTPTDERRVRVGERGDEGGGDEGGFASAGDDVFLPRRRTNRSSDDSSAKGTSVARRSFVCRTRPTFSAGSSPNRTRARSTGK